METNRRKWIITGSAVGLVAALIASVALLSGSPSPREVVARCYEISDLEKGKVITEEQANEKLSEFFVNKDDADVWRFAVECEVAAVQHDSDGLCHVTVENFKRVTSPSWLAHGVESGDLTQKDIDRGECIMHFSRRIKLIKQDGKWLIDSFEQAKSRFLSAD